MGRGRLLHRQMASGYGTDMLAEERLGPFCESVSGARSRRRRPGTGRRIFVLPLAPAEGRNLRDTKHETLLRRPPNFGSCRLGNSAVLRICSCMQSLPTPRLERSLTRNSGLYPSMGHIVTAQAPHLDVLDQKESKNMCTVLGTAFTGVGSWDWSNMSCRKITISCHKYHSYVANRVFCKTRCKMFYLIT